MALVKEADKIGDEEIPTIRQGPSILLPYIIRGGARYSLIVGAAPFLYMRVYVPKWALPLYRLRKELMKECHDSLWASNPGQKRTLALLERGPGMRKDVDNYVRCCLTCQQDKAETKLPGGLLKPLPVPVRPWASVSMDFITSLPRVQGYSSIMTVVDIFSKYATLIPCKHPCTAESAAM